MGDVLGGILSDVGLGGLVSSATAPASTAQPSTTIVTTTSTSESPTSSTTKAPTTTSLQTSTATTSPSTTSTLATSTRASTSASSTVPTATVTSTPKTSDSSNTGAIAAAVIACLAIFGLIVVAAVYFIRRKRKSERVSKRETKEFHKLEERAVPADLGTDGAAPFSPDSFGRAEKRPWAPEPEVHELADTSMPVEMDSGQRYHAYKPGR